MLSVTYIATTTKTVVVVNQPVCVKMFETTVKEIFNSDDYVVVQDILDYDSFYNLNIKILLCRCVDRGLLARLVLKANTLSGFRNLMFYMQSVLDVRRIANRHPSFNIEESLRLMILRKNKALSLEGLTCLYHEQFN